MAKIDTSRLLLGAIVLLIILGIAFAFYVFRSNPVEEALSAKRVINTLFVLENEGVPLSTYVLMYYPDTRHAAIFDIPGELGLLISRINRVDRIDSIYDSARTGAYQNEIEKLLGITIDFSIILTTENFVSVIDLLEGVEIFIPLPVFYRDDENLILFPSGINILDGDKAALYAVYSLPYEDAEMQVSRRQRLFYGFLNRQRQMNNRLQNREAAKIYYSLFNSNINWNTLALLFDEIARIDTDRTNIQTVGGTLREVSGQMLIIPHYDGNLIKEIVRQTEGSLMREIEDYNLRVLTVEVLNGTDVTGLAGRTAELLESFGYDISSIGNAENKPYENTVIIHRSGAENLVRAFADIIRCANIRTEMLTQEDLEEGRLEYKADITLIIGSDFNGRYVVAGN